MPGIGREYLVVGERRIVEAKLLVRRAMPALDVPDRFARAFRRFFELGPVGRNFQIFNDFDIDACLA